MIFKPTEKQKEAKKKLDQSDILVYGGGIRSGKSFFLLITLLTYAFKYDKSRWVVIRKDGVTIKRNLLPTLNALMEMGFWQYVKNFDRTMMLIKFTNGSELFFMSESFAEDKELNRFRGLEINGAGLDEINELQEVTFNKIIERTGSWTKAGNVPPKIIGTCNPSHGWVKKLFYDRWKTNKLPERWAYVPALITDNPHVSPAYLESLRKNMPKWEYEVFVNGNWDMKLEGSLFGIDEIKRYRKDDLKLRSGKTQFYDGCLAYIDVADEGTDYFSMPVGHIIGKKIYITDVLFSNANIDITLPLSVAMINKYNPEYVRIETNNHGSIFIKMLRQHVPVEKVLGISNSTNKHTRILMQYGFIKEHCLFLADEDIEENSPYYNFMKQLFSYNKNGKNDHDDAPDSLAGLCSFIQSFLTHLFNNPENE